MKGKYFIFIIFAVPFFILSEVCAQEGFTIGNSISAPSSSNTVMPAVSGSSQSPSFSPASNNGNHSGGNNVSAGNGNKGNGSSSPQASPMTQPPTPPVPPPVVPAGNQPNPAGQPFLSGPPVTMPGQDGVYGQNAAAGMQPFDGLSIESGDLFSFWDNFQGTLVGDGVGACDGPTLAMAALMEWGEANGGSAIIYGPDGTIIQGDPSDAAVIGIKVSGPMDEASVQALIEQYHELYPNAAVIFVYTAHADEVDHYPDVPGNDRRGVAVSNEFGRQDFWIMTFDVDLTFNVSQNENGDWVMFITSKSTQDNGNTDNLPAEASNPPYPQPDWV